MKNKLVVSVFLLVLVGIAGWYFVVKNKPNVVQQEEIVAWENYVDDRRGLEMEVPEGWVTEPLVIFTGTETLDENKYGGAAFGSPETANNEELTSEKRHPISYSFSPNSPEEVFSDQTEKLEDKVINDATFQVVKDGECYAYTQEHKGAHIYFDACGQSNVVILEHMLSTLKFTK